MSDLHERAVSQRGALERLMDKIPGFKGYMDRDRRRDSGFGRIAAGEVDHERAREIAGTCDRRCRGRRAGRFADGRIGDRDGERVLVRRQHQIEAQHRDEGVRASVVEQSQREEAISHRDRVRTDDHLTLCRRDGVDEHSF